jgi:Transglutaminase-like superfamily/TgpA N-terminal domain/Domain of unknown function (DUF4129)
VKERLTALAVLLVGLSLARAAPPALAAVAVALPLLGLAAGPRLRLDRVGEAGVTIGAMTLGVLAPRLLVSPELLAHDDPRLLGERTLLMAMPLLAVAAARSLVRAPAFGTRLTLAAALLALAAAGRALTGLAYPALSGLAVAAGFAALYAEDPVRPRLRLIGLRHLTALAVGAVVTVGLTASSAWLVPRLRDAAIARVMARWSRRTAFSDQMQLGAMAGMLQSDVVVMRLRGGAPPLLRGTVFTTYVAGRWETDAVLSSIEVVETPLSPPEPGALVQIENARTPARYFLPLGARDVAVSTGVYEKTPLGIYSPSLRFEAKRLWFAEGGGPEPSPPRPVDRHVPSRVKPALLGILRDWGATQEDLRARVDAIARRLQRDYRYTLEFDRESGADPVLDFLKTNRQGHCEYFASALALLARASGVPARLVAGYRVVETSPLGYSVVRERHAHSWVEVWVDGRWTTVDPTPAADLAMTSPATTPWLGAVADGLATMWERIDDWIERRSAFELSLALVGLIALLLAARVLRGTTVAARPRVAGDPPLAGFVALDRALARRGVSRGPTETLSRFALRVEQEGGLTPAHKAQAAALVRRYELVRYGGRGDAGALDREMADIARAVLASAPAGTPARTAER